MTSVLPTPVGPANRNDPVGLAEIGKARARHLDRSAKRLDGFVLPEDHDLEFALEIAKHFLVRERHVLRRNTCNLRHHLFDGSRSRRWSARSPDAVSDCAPASSMTSIALSGRSRSVDVTVRQFRCRAQRLVRILDVIVILEAALQAVENLDGLVDRRLHYVDLLKATRQARGPSRRSRDIRCRSSNRYNAVPRS